MKSINNKYEYTIDQELICMLLNRRPADASRSVHSPGGSTFLREITSRLPS